MPLDTLRKRYGNIGGGPVRAFVEESIVSDDHDEEFENSEGSEPDDESTFREAEQFVEKDDIDDEFS